MGAMTGPGRVADIESWAKVTVLVGENAFKDDILFAQIMEVSIEITFGCITHDGCRSCHFLTVPLQHSAFNAGERGGHPING
jgi:hypothetical protein